MVGSARETLPDLPRRGRDTIRTCKALSPGDFQDRSDTITALFQVDCYPDSSGSRGLAQLYAVVSSWDHWTAEGEGYDPPTDLSAPH